MRSPRIHFGSHRVASWTERGFTLVEVLLALGIVSFAFMALCGMLPVGLKTYRDAMDATCRANIVRVISAELAQAPYATIDAWNGQERFFSDQGLEVASAAAARFRVKYVNILSGTSLFGAINSSLRRRIPRHWKSSRSRKTSSRWRSSRGSRQHNPRIPPS